MHYQTLDFVKNYIQSSVGKAGSLVETFDLHLVFRTEQSLEKFKENFHKMELHGFILREENDFYYLDIKPFDSESESEFRSRDESLSGSRRKYNRYSTYLQLSPIKEAAVPTASEESNQTLLHSTIDSSDSSDVVELHNIEDDFNTISEKSNFISNVSCIFQVDQERVHMYLHFRDNNPQVKSIWKTVHQDIVTSIKLICTQVNQCLLLNDLYDTRLCNRLLEPESTEDIFRDSSRLHHNDIDESPYLEANLNMKFAPGKFQCPEVWETKF